MFSDLEMGNKQGRNSEIVAYIYEDWGLLFRHLGLQAPCFNAPGFVVMFAGLITTKIDVML